MLLRPPHSQDAPVLARLAGELGYPATADEILGRLQRLLGDPENAVIVAEDTETGVTGWIHVFVCHRLESGPCAEIGGLVVAAGRRGLGVGARLVAAAESWAAEHDLGEIRVRSNVLREGAHRFYERLGYRRVKSQAVFARDLRSREEPAPDGA